MSGQSFNLAMLLRADTAQAKAAIKEFRAEVQGVGQAATASATGIDRQRAAVDSNLAVLRNYGGVAGRAATETTAMAKATTSLIAANASLNAQSPAKMISGATAEFRMSRIEAENYRATLDHLRAAYNPLFAASRRYEAELKDIAAAEKLGAITAKEAAAARTRAAQSMAPMSGATGAGRGARGGGVNPMYTANIAAQGNDIMMMAMMGQNPLQLALQQGTQVSQVLNQMGGGKAALSGLASGFMSMVNPISLATIGIIAFGSAALQALGSALPETKSVDEAFADMADSIDGYKSRIDAARKSMAELAAQFGSAASEARAVLETMAQVERRQAGRSVGDMMRAIPDGMEGEDEFGALISSSESRRFSKIQSLINEGHWLTRGIGISEEENPNSYRIMEALTQLRALRDSNDLEAQIGAAEALDQAFKAAITSTGASGEEIDDWMMKIQELRTGLMELRGQDENAKARQELADLNKELSRQAELSRVIAEYGEKSAQAEAVRRRQSREDLRERLNNTGLALSDPAVTGVLAADQAAYIASRQAAAAAAIRPHSDRLADLQAETALRQRLTAAVASGTLTQQQADEQLKVESQLRPLIREAAEADGETKTRLTGIIEKMRAALLGLNAAQREAAARQFIQQQQIGAALDQYDSAAALSRNPIDRANIEAQREYNRLILDGKSAAEASAAASRQRARAVAEVMTGARSAAADMLDELSIRQRVSEQVATGAITAAEANTVLQREQQLRPLLAAAAAAEGAEKARLTQIIEGLRLAYEAVAIEEQRQAANAYLQSQAEKLQQLKLEAQLLGQNATVRARVLALIEAERKIRELGLTGREADEVRRQVREQSALTRELEKQADAWGAVQEAGSSAIDSIVDQLMGGDIEGALEGLASEIAGLFTDLAIKNPLKNAILGTDYATTADIGGLNGIWDRLMGRAPFDEAGVIEAGAQRVQAMTISAATVTINAGAFGPGAFGGAANINGPLPALGGGDVPAQIWKFFAGKGLQPHQIAGIMGNIHAESGFNPTALQPDGNGTGLFQHDDRRFKLLDFIGGKGNLGNVQGQLEFAWQELMTTESRAMRNLMRAGNVQDATAAFVGFERPAGFTWANPEGSHNFDGRLRAAEKAMETFGRTAVTATGDLSTLGTGFGDFGQALSGLQIGGGSAGSGWLGQLISIGAQAFGLPGFSSGGATGGSDPGRVAGVVHEQEYVFDAASTARIGVKTLEGLRKGALRGFSSGGYTGGSQGVAVIGQAPGTSITVNNFSGQPVTQEESTDARGQRQITMTVGEAVGSAMLQPGNPANRAMRSGFGLQRRSPAR